MKTLPTATAFAGHCRIASGTLDSVALALRADPTGQADGPVLTFDDNTGKVVDLDLRGSDREIIARLETRYHTATDNNPPRGPGRPRLGVVAREVTLLPHHWDWLATQRGGASAALRRLVEDARRAGGSGDQQRVAEERTYRFIVAMAGDLPAFEEATRALFAHDREGFAARISEWPTDIGEYALKLLSNTSGEARLAPT